MIAGTLPQMPEPTVSVRIRRALLKDIKRAALETDETLIDWIGEAIRRRLDMDHLTATGELVVGTVEKEKGR